MAPFSGRASVQAKGWGMAGRPGIGLGQKSTILIPKGNLIDFCPHSTALLTLVLSIRYGQSLPAKHQPDSDGKRVRKAGQESGLGCRRDSVEQSRSSRRNSGYSLYLSVTIRPDQSVSNG